MHLYKLVNGGAIAPVADTIDGRRFSRRLKKPAIEERVRLKKLTIEERLLLAHDLQQVTVRLHNLLFELHHKRRLPISDAAVEKLVTKIGHERVMSALDRLTRPASPVAAE